jgi:hypothetical protein
MSVSIKELEKGLGGYYREEAASRKTASCPECLGHSLLRRACLGQPIPPEARDHLTACNHCQEQLALFNQELNICDVDKVLSSSSVEEALSTAEPQPGWILEPAPLRVGGGVPGGLIAALVRSWRRAGAWLAAPRPYRRRDALLLRLAVVMAIVAVSFGIDAARSARPNSKLVVIERTKSFNAQEGFRIVRVGGIANHYHPRVLTSRVFIGGSGDPAKIWIYMRTDPDARWSVPSVKFGTDPKSDQSFTLRALLCAEGRTRAYDRRVVLPFTDGVVDRRAGTYRDVGEWYLPATLILDACSSNAHSPGELPLTRYAGERAVLPSWWQLSERRRVEEQEWRLMHFSTHGVMEPGRAPERPER